MTNERRILNYIAANPDRDDDEISAALEIRPRQQVNQICLRLSDARRITRFRGPRGKIVNRAT